MKKKKRIAPEEYRRILTGLDLLDISLSRSEGFSNKDPKITFLKLNVNISDNSNFTLTEDGFVDIIHSYKLKAVDPESETVFLAVNATFNVRMKSTEPFTKDFFEIYKDLSLQINTWPYFREFVQNMTSRMNIPSLTLPLFKQIPKAPPGSK